MNDKIKKAIKEIKENGLKGYCPFKLDSVDGVTSENQQKSFCKDGCSVECPKFYLEKLEKRVK